MSTLDYYIATTLDGFISRADHSFNFFLQDPEHLRHYVARIQSYDTILMGRATYQVGVAQGVTDPYPWARSLVFSRSLGALPAPRLELVDGDAAVRVRALKQETDSPIYLCGGGQLAGSLLAAGLVDRVILKQHPLLLGEGIPLVSALPAAVRLRLSAEQAFGEGIVERCFEVI